MTNDDYYSKRKRSNFPAVDSYLDQFRGTELAPLPRGTYYRPEKYVGFHGDLRRVADNLSKAYQSDLAYNVAANPTVARNLDAERIGATYGGSSKFGGDPNSAGNYTAANPATTREYYANNTLGIKNGLRTIELPSGGTTTIRDRSNYGGQVRDRSPSPALAQMNYEANKAKGFGEPAPTASANGFVNQGGVAIPAEQLTAGQRSQYGLGAQYGTSFGERFAAQNPTLVGAAELTGLPTLGRMAVAGVQKLLGSGTSNAQAAPVPQQSASPQSNYFAYNPSPAQPRRYFDYY